MKRQWAVVGAMCCATAMNPSASSEEQELRVVILKYDGMEVDKARGHYWVGLKNATAAPQVLCRARAGYVYAVSAEKESLWYPPGGPSDGWLPTSETSCPSDELRLLLPGETFFMSVKVQPEHLAGLSDVLVVAQRVCMNPGACSREGVWSQEPVPQRAETYRQKVSRP